MEKRRRITSARWPVWAVAMPAALAAVALVLAYLTPASALCWDVAWTASALAAVIGTLLARREAIGTHRSRWTLWAKATGCWLFGQLAWDLFGIIGSPASPNPADLGWGAFAVLVMLSIVRMPAQSKALRMVTAAEVLPVIAAAAALTFAELWHDVDASMLAIAPRLSALVYPTLYLSAAVLALQALLGGAVTSVRSLPSRLVLGGTHGARLRVHRVE
jgi:hypothetical protein